MRIPILALGTILIPSIQSDITDEHAIQLQTDILERLKYLRACGVILDITGLDIIDSYIALTLNETLNMAQLMGGEVIISGMVSMVALTLVEMNGELICGMTALTLEHGVEKLKQRFLESADGLAEVLSDDEQ